jgi:AraC family transcriptional regulator
MAGISTLQPSKRACREHLRVAVPELFNAVNNALLDERELAQEYVHRARPVLGPYLVDAPSMPPLRDDSPKPMRGGLALWQIRRVTTHIETNIDTTIRTKDLAGLVGLSRFYFCRAFKDSFGDSPHRYVMRRRVERAQGLMLTTGASLGEIAADCGLADQAHLNKLFDKFVGESPGAWRRARAIPSMDGISEVHTAKNRHADTSLQLAFDRTE